MPTTDDEGRKQKQKEPPVQERVRYSRGAKKPPQPQPPQRKRRGKNARPASDHNSTTPTEPPTNPQILITTPATAGAQPAVVTSDGASQAAGAASTGRLHPPAAAATTAAPSGPSTVRVTQPDPTDPMTPKTTQAATKTLRATLNEMRNRGNTQQNNTPTNTTHTNAQPSTSGTNPGTQPTNTTSPIMSSLFGQTNRPPTSQATAVPPIFQQSDATSDPSHEFSGGGNLHYSQSARHSTPHPGQGQPSLAPWVPPTDDRGERPSSIRAEPTSAPSTFGAMDRNAQLIDTMLNTNQPIDAEALLRSLGEWTWPMTALTTRIMHYPQYFVHIWYIFLTWGGDHELDPNIRGIHE